MSLTHVAYSYVVFTIILFLCFIPRTVTVLATPIPRGLDRDTNIALITPVLATVTVQPGQTWSFNETVGHPDMYPLITAGGVYGGGWCDIASRYAEIARFLNWPREFQLHSTPLLEVERQDNVSIWNEDGSKTQSQDLRITNTSSFPVTFTLTMTQDQFTVRASWSQPYFWRSGLSPLPSFTTGTQM
jgi:hypothetical protein